MSEQVEVSATEETPEPRSEKKPFVFPQISAPVDVLEATTYFQALESGASN
jgi:hypothetical protein